MAPENRPSQREQQPGPVDPRAAALMRLATHRGAALLVAIVLTIVLFGGIFLVLGLPLVFVMKAHREPPPAPSPADPANP